MLEEDQSGLGKHAFAFGQGRLLNALLHRALDLDWNVDDGGRPLESLSLPPVVRPPFDFGSAEAGGANSGSLRDLKMAAYPCAARGVFFPLIRREKSWGTAWCASRAGRTTRPRPPRSLRSTGKTAGRVRNVLRTRRRWLWRRPGRAPGNRMGSRAEAAPSIRGVWRPAQRRMDRGSRSIMQGIECWTTCHLQSYMDQRVVAHFAR